MSGIHLQYDILRNQISKDFIIFFQIGDFFEIFDEDANLVSGLIGLTLTKRQTRPMCGVPCKSIQFYIYKLSYLHNCKIALCEQDNRQVSNNLIVRKLTKRYMKGLIGEEYNTISSVVVNQKYAHIYTTDILTQKVSKYQCSINELNSYLSRINSSVVLANAPLKVKVSVYIMNNSNYIYTPNQYNDENLQILSNFFAWSGHIWTPSTQVSVSNVMTFGINTIRNLDIFYDRDNNKKNSLIYILNATNTAMGYRYLSNSLRFPSCIRQDLVSSYDYIEKIIQYLQSKHQASLIWQIEDLASLCNNSQTYKRINRLYKSGIKAMNLIIKLHELKLIPEPYIYLTELYSSNIFLWISTMFNDENLPYNTNLSNLYQDKEKLYINMQTMVSKISEKASLEQHSLLGYVIKSTNRNYQKDELYIERKRNKNHIYFTTTDLLKLESEMMEILNLIQAEEDNLIKIIQTKINQHRAFIMSVSECIGLSDFYFSCAKNSIKYDLSKPSICDTPSFIVEDGFNIMLTGDIIIHNDCNLEGLMIVTGVNMGGKTTFLKQNAIIVLMAQAGMYTPGKVSMSVKTSLFVRIGAHDNIFDNKSTFFIEMEETSEIFTLCDQNSFVVIDEVGRGTSYTEGLSISGAICNYLALHKITSIVSTHYLKLHLIMDSTHTQWCQVTCKHDNDQIYPMYKISEGIAKSSHAFITAKNAGLPMSIIKSANDIFKQLN